MGRVKIRYYTTKNGNGFWQPNKAMRAAGFEPVACGPDGPEAWKIAERANERWDVFRKSEIPPPKYPVGSIGDAWERFRNTDEWKIKSQATRDEWDYAWGWIEPVFGDVAPRSIELELISELRSIVKEKVSNHAAHRVTKVWRAFWKIMAAMKLCERDADPSLGIRNTAPKGRSETWTAGEAAQLAKTAWRNGYKGLAAIISVIWDTQFQPADARLLTPSQRCRDATGDYFDTSRSKTDTGILGTLTRRSTRVLDAYIESLGVELMGDAKIFRNRSGSPYTKNKLAVDFRKIRQIVKPGETRKLMDMRRSGAVEAIAGEVADTSLSQKMGNSLSQSKRLQDTYLPKRAATVRLADEARVRGRTTLRRNEK